jgi:hypothetical protein
MSDEEVQQWRETRSRVATAVSMRGQFILVGGVFCALLYCVGALCVGIDRIDPRIPGVGPIFGFFFTVLSFFMVGGLVFGAVGWVIGQIIGGTLGGSQEAPTQAGQDAEKE